MNDKTIYFEAGDCVIIPPLMTHRCAPQDIKHWVYVMLFIDPGYYSEAVSFSQAKKLTGTQARKLRGFIEQLLREKIPDTLENILFELLLELGEKDISGITPADTSDIVKTIRDFICPGICNDSCTAGIERDYLKDSICRNYYLISWSLPDCRS